jgi:hypothetical protein
MKKHIWKYGWFWGVLGTILIVTVPALVLSLLGADRGGSGEGGVRQTAFGFFWASNHIEIKNEAAPPNKGKAARE